MILNFSSNSSKVITWIFKISSHLKLQNNFTRMLDKTCLTRAMDFEEIISYRPNNQIEQYLNQNLYVANYVCDYYTPNYNIRSGCTTTLYYFVQTG